MERKDALMALGAVALGVGGFLGYKGYQCLTLQNQACINWLTSRNGQSQPSVNTPENSLVGDVSSEQQSISESLPIASILVDPETGTKFDVVIVNGIRCIRLTAFTAQNWQDVWRASKNLGYDQSQYSDHDFFYVFNPDLSFLGSFHTTQMPDEATFGVVPINTLICENDIDQLD